ARRRDLAHLAHYLDHGGIARAPIEDSLRASPGVGSLSALVEIDGEPREDARQYFGVRAQSGAYHFVVALPAVERRVQPETASEHDENRGRLRHDHATIAGEPQPDCRPRESRLLEDLVRQQRAQKHETMRLRGA